VIRWYPPSSAASVTAARELFAASFAGSPDGVWSAPGRVNLIGEHVDYAGGICLPFALPQRTFAAVRPRTDGVLRLVSGQLDEPWTGRIADVGPGRPDGWAGYPAGVAWALCRAGLLPDLAEGADVAIHSDVPVGAGLSSAAEAAELLASGRLAELGPLLTASHASLRDDYEVSCPELESAVSAAHQAGALGARLVGGGFGRGSAIALVASAELEAVASSVADAARRHGLAEPSFLRAEASGAAGREFDDLDRYDSR
jgi:galactokinase